MSVVLLDQALAAKDVAAKNVESTGRSSPLGATVVPGGVNFSVFSRGAVAVELLLFGRADDPRPTRCIPIDSASNRTYHYGHVFVPGCSRGSFMGIGSRAPSIQRPGCASIPPRF